MVSNAAILVIEDEEPIAELIEYNLSKEGFEVQVEYDGESGLLATEEREFDLLVVDWMLPEKTGIDIIRSLRSNNRTTSMPIIMLTARGEEEDRLLGLDVGADDYMVKPFSPKELTARIHAVLRRVRPAAVSEQLACGDLTIDVASQRTQYKGTDIHLGPTEFKLLAHFLKNPNRIYSREQLLDQIWGFDVYVEERTVDTYIRRLRSTLAKADGALESLIQTKRGAGYLLVSGDSEST